MAPEATCAFGSGVLGATALELRPGTVLGDWRIEAKIGEGGMGTVYAAIHDVIGKRAAIKVIRGDVCDTPGASERFVREARLVNQIGHRNIVDIFHVGTLDDGRPYLVMELLAGETLADRLAGGRIPALEAIEILLQIGAALGAAHAGGIIHRDLKPDNIILATVHDKPVVKLLDWGIAKLVERRAGDQPSGQGTMIGTPRYVAPEQARGRAVDARTDLYSLGVIAYEIFLETPPFTADNVADLLAAHLREPVPPPRELWPDIPADLERILLAMLAKKPDDRPSLEDVIAALVATRQELERRAGRAPTEPPAAVANLAVPVGDWSHEPPAAPERDALLATSQLDAVAPPPSRRRQLATAGLTVGSAFVVVLAFARVFGVTGPGLGAVARAHAARPATRAPAPPPSVLDVRFSPAGGLVLVDGVAVPSEAGRAVRMIAQGKHTIAIVADGHAPYRREVDVGPGSLLLAVDLVRVEPAPPRVQAASPPGKRRPRPRIHPDAVIDPYR